MKKKRPTCWIKESRYPGDYTIYDTKPNWLKLFGEVRMDWLPEPGSRCYTVDGQTISALIGDEWELPKKGELLEVVDGVPKRVHVN